MSAYSAKVSHAPGIACAGGGDKIRFFADTNQGNFMPTPEVIKLMQNKILHLSEINIIITKNL